MTDVPPVAPPAAAKLPLTPTVTRVILHGLRDLGPYALALTVFAITANVALNPTASHYADELFTLALVLIRTGSTPPPTAPPPAGQG